MDGELKNITENFFVRAHVPQNFVLEFAQAVISCGHTTSVLGALTHGLPSLLIPNGSGTEDIAECCEKAGVCVYLPLSQVSPDTLLTTIQRLLQDSELRQNAKKIQQAFRKVNGLEYAGDLLEQLGITRRRVLRKLPELCLG
jgi:UDP:flavonoid glycosyltransferase YjiC (YdhE family)